jgi:metal-sulfur cluster biosynthetic enzyme
MGAGPSEAQVRAELDAIVDPCSRAAGAPAGLDEMGLVREVAVDSRPGGVAVRVVLGLTEPSCLMGVPFARTARERLAALEDVVEVDVELASGIDWTPADLSPMYAARLERARERRRRALSRADAAPSVHSRPPANSS